VVGASSIVALILTPLQGPTSLNQETTLVEGRFVRIESKAGEAQAVVLKKMMDQAFEVFPLLLGRESSPNKPERARVLLLQDERSYLAEGGPPGTLGYNDGARIVGFSAPGEFWIPFIHEGMHHFIDRNLGGAGQLPVWFTEGMADLAADGPDAPLPIVAGPPPPARGLTLRAQYEVPIP
jgi:hypothetical protein